MMQAAAQVAMKRTPPTAARHRSTPVINLEACCLTGFVSDLPFEPQPAGAVRLCPRCAAYHAITVTLICHTPGRSLQAESWFLITLYFVKIERYGVLWDMRRRVVYHNYDTSLRYAVPL